jgi:pyruvate dehydrogenase E1 component alpha subunit
VTTHVAPEVDRDVLIDLYRTVAKIRAAEILLQDYVTNHGFPGFWHPGLGQEGLQAGATHALRKDDYMFQAHRGLGYALGKGLPLSEIFGDLLGRTTGASGKGGGTVHFASREWGVMGQGGTLGSNFHLGVGAGISAQLLGEDKVAMVFFGDGASARGTLYESAIEASVWKVPVIFVCENNGWAISVPFADHAPTPNVADRAAAFGFPGVVVDGQDPVAVYVAVSEAVARARGGEGPTLIEAMTLRQRGHYEGDRQKYRLDLELDLAQNPRARDPLDVLRAQLDGVDLDEIEKAATDEVHTEFEAALQAPELPDEAAFSHVWAS